MTEEDHKFLHDIMNKLAKIEGFSSMLKMDLGEENPKLMKIEKATTEAIELVRGYRALLEKLEK